MIIVFKKNYNLKLEHNYKSQKIKETINLLQQNQNLLNEKVTITSRFEVEYKEKCKKLINMVIELQNTFIELLKETKNK